MKKICLSLLLCLACFSVTVQAQHPISFGFTSGWGGGTMYTDEIQASGTISIDPFWVIPIGLQARYMINDRWAVQARGMFYWSSYNVRTVSPEGWTSIRFYDNPHGGIEFGVVRRVPLRGERLFFSVEAALSYQANVNAGSGCGSSASGDFSGMDTLWQVSRNQREGDPFFPSGHLRLNLEHDFLWGKRPFSIIAGVYASHSFVGYGRGFMESWNGLDIETTPFQVGGNPNQPTAVRPVWNCNTPASRPADAAHSWTDWGASVGLQFSILFHMTRIEEE
ncbi:MAG: hypothetical protein AAFR61_10015 [Bacteroidota bacterium]